MAELKKQKVALTELLRNTIKSLRLTYKKNGVVLSKELGKGASYISQIESGKIQDIEYDMIHTIFQQITNMSGKEYAGFIKEYILNLIKTLTKEEYSDELWIHVYVLQDMSIDIPDDLVELIKKELIDSPYESPQEVIEILNRNERFGNDNNQHRILIDNKLYLTITKYPTKNKYISSETIYYNLPLNYLEQILTKEVTSISYINMKPILYILYQPKTDNRSLVKLFEIHKILKQNGFFNSMEWYEHLNFVSKEDQISHKLDIKKAVSKKDIFFYDNTFSVINEKYEDLKMDALDKISNVFDKYKEENNSYACDILEKIIRNLDSDSLLLVSILYSNLCDLDVSSKLTFWDEYKKLVQRFSKDNIDS